MTTTKLFAQLTVALGLLAAPASASAEGAVHAFLRAPLINPAATTLRIVPPQGGQVMLQRAGKAARWFVQPGVIQIEPGVTYDISAVRDNTIVFRSGIMAQPGLMDVVWTEASDTPRLQYHAPAVVNPLGMGLVSHAAVPAAALRTAVSADALDAMLDDLQTKHNDFMRWNSLNRYAQRFWFTDAQIDQIVLSFDGPRYQNAAARLLARRRLPQP